MPPRVEGQPGIENLVRVQLRGVFRIDQTVLDPTPRADLVPRPVPGNELGLRVVLLAQPAYWHYARNNQRRIVLQGYGLEPVSVVIQCII